MTIASVQTASGTSAAGASSVSATLGSTATSGNLLIVAVAFDKNAGTITGPSGFTQVFSSASTSVSLWVGYKVSAGTETSVSASRSNTSGSSGDTIWVGEVSDSTSGTWTIHTTATHYTDETSVTSWASGTAADPGRACAAMAFFAIDSTHFARTSQSFSDSYATLRAWAGTTSVYRSDIAVGWLSSFAGGSSTSTTHTHSPDTDQVSGAVMTFGRASSDATATPAVVAATATVPSVTVSAGAGLPVTDPFTGDDADPWSSQIWTSAVTTTGATATISGNRGRLNAGTLTSYAGKKSMRYAGAAQADVLIYGLLQYVDSGVDCNVEVWARGPSSGDSSTGYFAKLVRGGTISLYKAVSGTYTSLGTASFTINSTTDYRWKFRVVGSAQQLKVWAATDIEPSAWTIEAADTAITAAGYTLLHLTGGSTASGRVDFDDVTITDGSQHAAISPSAVAASSAVPATTHSAGATAAPSVVAATTTTPAATASADSGATVTAPVVQTSATTPAVAPGAGCGIAAAAIVTVAATPAATVTTGATVTAATVPATATAPAVTASAGTGTTVTAATVTATTAVPASAASAGATVTATTVSATTHTPTAAVATGAGVAAVVVAVSAATPAVSLGGGVSISATTVAATATTPTTAVGAGAAVAPTVAAAIAAAPPVSAGGGSGLTAAVVAVSASTPAVTAGAGSALATTTVATVATTPAVQVSAGSGVALVLVVATADVPDPMVVAGGGVVVHPATVAASATVPAPGVPVGVEISPDVVRAVVAVLVARVRVPSRGRAMHLAGLAAAASVIAARSSAAAVIVGASPGASIVLGEGDPQ